MWLPTWSVTWARRTGERFSPARRLAAAAEDADEAALAGRPGLPAGLAATGASTAFAGRPGRRATGADETSPPFLSASATASRADWRIRSLRSLTNASTRFLILFSALLIRHRVSWIASLCQLPIFNKSHFHLGPGGGLLGGDGWEPISMWRPFGSPWGTRSAFA